MGYKLTHTVLIYYKHKRYVYNKLLAPLILNKSHNVKTGEIQ